jgi:SAM-dependent methyltransferase
MAFRRLVARCTFCGDSLPEVVITRSGPSDPGPGPLAGSAWSRPDTVAGFSQSPPNDTLMQFAERERHGASRRLLDIGCGAGRNALPLASTGWNVFGADLSLAMLHAAATRAREEHLEDRLRLVLAAMHELPFAAASADFIIAHGIWNLARSSHEFRRAVAEAARVARHGSALFVFTFSRHTLPDAAQPVPGESFVFTQFSGARQCFLTEDQLVSELRAAEFEPDPSVPLRELNRPQRTALRTSGAPVIYEGVFRRK